MIRKEKFMEKGGRVMLSTGNGTITSVVECRLGKTTAPSKYMGEPMVMQLYVQPDGVLNSWPVNPNEVAELRKVSE